MQIILTIAVLGVASTLFLASCSSDDKATSTAPTAGPVMITPDQVDQPGAGAAQATNSEGVLLNPPHGEPGHVCEIPVGEPLSGGGSANPMGGQTINVGQQPIMVSPNSQVTTSSTGSGKINPPHGEPGHDCAVPVGEPLP